MPLMPIILSYNKCLASQEAIFADDDLVAELLRFPMQNIYAISRGLIPLRPASTGFADRLAYYSSTLPHRPYAVVHECKMWRHEPKNRVPPAESNWERFAPRPTSIAEMALISVLPEQLPDYQQTFTFFSLPHISTTTI
jgi:hypothetical protein